MSEEKLSVTRSINASADAIFDVLTRPERHRDFDGSSMVQSGDASQRIQAVGDVFRMNMHADGLGDYTMENHVTACAPNKVVGWAPAMEGMDPMGHTWTYTLEPEGPDSTEVTLTYDWSGLKPGPWMEKLPSIPTMPVIPQEALEQSLNLLAESVA
ncbi:SRPBCC family protein [Enemella sp. A6]|uniref:SRPBCC family protein n=1 Tax=Enemella sp. A6 TaxID=3440152 RepID=UPI003EC07E6B